MEPRIFWQERELHLPFCTNCGNEVRPVDRFCRRCGTAQPPPAQSARPAASTPSVGGGISPNGAATLCYIPLVGWIAAVWALVTERFRRDRLVRFHAYQGLYLFVTWLLTHWVLDLWSKILFNNRVPLGDIAEALLLIVWIYMLVRTASGRRTQLPVLGDLAERSL